MFFICKVLTMLSVEYSIITFFRGLSPVSSLPITFYNEHYFHMGGITNEQIYFESGSLRVISRDLEGSSHNKSWWPYFFFAIRCLPDEYISSFVPFHSKERWKRGQRKIEVAIINETKLHKSIYGRRYHATIRFHNNHTLP